VVGPKDTHAPTSNKRASSTLASPEEEEHRGANSTSPNVTGRFLNTIEVCVSKIFPAGFGWQAGSLVAADLGAKATDLSFALCTGAGDALGVFVGHTLYYAMKKAAVDSSIDLTQQAHTGLFLATAACFSGGIWQPVVNLLQASGDLSFSQVALGTSAVCGFSFFFGLRTFRIVYNNMGLRVEKPRYHNLKADAQLSMSIGGAGGGFVGTDTAYHIDENFLKNIVGVTELDSQLASCIKAGSATSLGFAAFQSVQNVTYKKNTNWTD